VAKVEVCGVEDSMNPALGPCANCHRGNDKDELAAVTGKGTALLL
jgi:hypothetical protein